LITIIIPNYNGESHLRTFIPSLLNQTYRDYQLILVDNGSEDNSKDYIKETVSNSIIIELDHNSGFARAVNEGIKFSLNNINAEYILLLNNDIELDKNFLQAGINAFKNVPDASFIATKMLNYFEREIIDDCGDSIRLVGGSPIARGHEEKDTGQYDKGEYIFGVCAGAGFYKKELFETVGLMDERFIAYYEDFDFSFRAELMGFKAYYEPRVICYHKRGGTSSLFTKGYQTEMCERNLILLRFKNYPLSIYILYQPLFLVSRLRRYLFFYIDYSYKIFFSAIKGYIRGTFMIFSYIPERFRIQRSRKISVKQIKDLLSK
jgi:GT2 family glycosyltransferase